MTVNDSDNDISELSSKDINDKPANSGTIPFSLKNTTDGGSSFEYLKISSP